MLRTVGGGALTGSRPPTGRCRTSTSCFGVALLRGGYALATEYADEPAAVDLSAAGVLLLGMMLRWFTRRWRSTVSDKLPAAECIVEPDRRARALLAAGPARALPPAAERWRSAASIL